MDKIARGLIIFVVLIVLVCALLIGVFLYFFPLKYKDIIIKYANEYDVPPSLIAGIINAESGFKNTAVSKVGAVGLMQIMPSTAEYVANTIDLEYNEVKLFEPEFNIEIGTAYISKLIKQFNDIDTAICAYNAGPNNVSTWLLDTKYSQNGIKLDSTPFPATNYYLVKVKQNEKVYTKFF